MIGPYEFPRTSYGPMALVKFSESFSLDRYWSIECSSLRLSRTLTLWTPGPEGRGRLSQRLFGDPGPKSPRESPGARGGRCCNTRRACNDARGQRRRSLNHAELAMTLRRPGGHSLAHWLAGACSCEFTSSEDSAFCLSKLLGLRL